MRVWQGDKERERLLQVCWQKAATKIILQASCPGSSLRWECEGVGEQWEGPRLDLSELNLVPRSQARAWSNHILCPRRQNPARTFRLDTQDSSTQPQISFPLTWD